jgi:cyclopropane-fatty-acyl-phospholipid synthase
MTSDSPTVGIRGGTRRRGRLERLFRSLLIRRLERLRSGRITLREGDERIVLGREDASGLHCELRVHDPGFWRRVVRGGSIGAAEAYMAGLWSADDLTTLIRILARDRRLNLELDRGWARIPLLVGRIGHWLRRNTPQGSRRNIADHYDLGNEFFATFLDPTMSYSCAVFDRPEASLEQASVLKNDLVCRKLRLRPEDELLEIGTGWGGLAIHAAREYGCRVVSTTLSREQRDFATERVRELGLHDRVTVLLEDYRALPGRLGRRFDKLVSIEMIEAVGHENLGRYFRVCSQLLDPRGTMLLQAIVIADRYYERYRTSVDFIQRYIFPGGCLPSLTAMCAAMTRSSDLRVHHLQDITPHYATTLRRWRESFEARRDRIDALGFPERFRRMWEFYFCYCEGGFLERTIGDLQLLLARPLADVGDPVPQI